MKKINKKFRILLETDMDIMNMIHKIDALSRTAKTIDGSILILKEIIETQDED